MGVENPKVKPPRKSAAGVPGVMHALEYSLEQTSLVRTATADSGREELYLMCDDIDATVKELEAKGVEFTGPVSDAGFGRLTSLRVPGGGELGLYQPRHPLAINL